MNTSNLTIFKKQLPLPILRWIIRKKLNERIKKESITDVEAFHSKFQSLVESLKLSPIAVEAACVSVAHTNLPAEFYQILLGKRLKFSCNIWQNDQNLEAAEEDTLKQYCQKADIQDGQKIMDMGCGWGPLTFYIAENYKNCTIIAITNSLIQKKYIEQQVKQKGLSNIKLVLNNINNYDTSEKFDRIISIEMLEHLRNYQKLFAKLNFFVKDQGKIFIQTIVNRQFCYTFDEKEPGNWLAQYFYPCGTMAWNNLLYRFNDHFKVVDHWVYNGHHYHKTAEEWLKNLIQKKDVILPIFEQNYGKEEAMFFYNLWKTFLVYLSEMFNYKHGDMWFTSQYLMVKNDYTLGM